MWLELERDGMVGYIEQVSPWVQPANESMNAAGAAATSIKRAREIKLL